MAEVPTSHILLRSTSVKPFFGLAKCIDSQQAAVSTGSE
jgi:hypothetical protein